MLLDSTSPEQIRQYKSFVPPLNQAISAIRAIGVLRLIDMVAPQMLENSSFGSRNDFVMVDEHYRELDKIFTLQKYQNKMIQKEQKMRQANAQAVYEVGCPSEIPFSLIGGHYIYHFDSQGVCDIIEQLKSKY